ncbi:MAG: hypothetical protein WAT27_09850 [Chitinophagales bacterium]|jgi:hypothetical protein
MDIKIHIPLGPLNSFVRIWKIAAKLMNIEQKITSINRTTENTSIHLFIYIFNYKWLLYEMD